MLGAWDRGEWLNPPQSATVDGDQLIVVAKGDTDFWRTTAYGFVHDNGHALLQPWLAEESVEVTFVVDFDQQFDQAGVLVRRDASTWMGGSGDQRQGPAVGAVVTHDRSDWSSPVPEWQE
jgi:regulation of enolase protein 1 (concanavalin A-like superfamily)